jgi:large conductance mechanosensitive channel
MECSLYEAGNTINAVTLNWGNFVQTTFDFMIVAFAIFILIKAMNNLKKKEEVIQAAPPEPSKEEKLLTEIRDLLKK